MKGALVALYLALTAAAIAALGGWIANIFKLIALIGATGDHALEFLIRSFGIIVPIIGVIAGYA